jgi:hypothetical protein
MHPNHWKSWILNNCQQSYLYIIFYSDFLVFATFRRRTSVDFCLDVIVIWLENSFRNLFSLGLIQVLLGNLYESIPTRFFSCINNFMNSFSFLWHIIPPCFFCVLLFSSSEISSRTCHFLLQTSEFTFSDVVLFSDWRYPISQHSLFDSWFWLFIHKGHEQFRKDPQIIKIGNPSYYLPWSMMVFIFEIVVPHSQCLTELY